MKSKRNFIFPLIYLLIGVLLMGFPQNVLAAPAITGIFPGTVSAGVESEITIYGTGFESGLTTSLEGYGNLQASYSNSQTIIASIPSDIPVGTYTLRVTNPDGTWANLFNAFSVSNAPISTIPIRTPEINSQQVDRPIIVIDSYKTSKNPVLPGESFNVEIRIVNRGSELATNVIISFQVGELVPQQTGGVLAVKEIDPGERKKLEQPMIATYELAGQTIATIPVTITYGDLSGNSYSGSFSIAVNIQQVYSGVAPTETSTPTTAPITLPQLVIVDYSIDAPLLQPGVQFQISVDVKNLGAASAKSVSMVVGGGTIAIDPNATPGPGGVSGGDSDLTNFAPLGTSNVKFLGDIDINEKITAVQDLIVNVNTNPGAYPLKISFVYSTLTGERLVDDQVVTLLVYSPPVVDIGFYQDPGFFFAGQPNLAPIQVINLGRNTVVLGNMRITSSEADLTNNVVLVGNLEAGGYFPLDASCVPYAQGTLELLITVDYTDDFNQNQVFSKTLTVEVSEAPPIEFPPGNDDGSGIPGGSEEPSSNNESLWQKVVRFLKGLFGLDSSPDQGTVPVESLPSSQEPVFEP